ncbi:MAG: hypothetical protein DLM72_12645 [Candidatus Nitrosopolaris wilkensis]|nr:MAG: hypothetical protein DLM72_12645 [Candidatus Nitrosopolaris wilkensis]
MTSKHDDNNVNENEPTHSPIFTPKNEQEDFGGKTHVDKSKKIDKKGRPPHSSTVEGRRNGPVATSTVKLMSFIIVKAIESDTSYLQSQWPLFALKELLDNAWDFLNDYYSQCPKEDRKIGVSIKIDRKPQAQKDILCIRVRNSNVDNILVFENLYATFNYDQWYSTKRYQHRETCGSLGDFLKRGLDMGYAAWTEGIDDDNSFTDEQWEEPLIVRRNGKETRVFIVVNKGSSEPIKVEFEDGPSYDYTYTEVEVALPLSYWNESLTHQLEEYYKRYKIGKSKMEFSFDAEIPPNPEAGTGQEEELRYGQI